MKAKAWNDSPYCSYSIDGALIDEDGDLRLSGRKIQIRWIVQANLFRAEGDATEFFTGLAYDRAGTFYGIKQQGDRPSNVIERVEVLHGKAALSWFARHVSWDEPFARELCRAIANPEFEFMELVATRELPKGRRKGKLRKRAEALHQQLHLATALVECVRRLEAAPSLDALTEACRAVSELHTRIHDPENFKLAAAG